VVRDGVASADLPHFVHGAKQRGKSILPLAAVQPLAPSSRAMASVLSDVRVWVFLLPPGSPQAH
jgi:hypothetical protein